MYEFTSDQLRIVRGIAQEIAEEELRFPVVNGGKRPRAVEGLANYLYESRIAWAVAYFEGADIFVGGGQRAVIDRFFRRYCFDLYGEVVPNRRGIDWRSAA